MTVFIELALTLHRSGVSATIIFNILRFFLNRASFFSVTPFSACVFNV